MRFSLNLRWIFSIYCCQILENIKITGPCKEEIWTPKHWTCNITTGRQLCPNTFGGRCISIKFAFWMAKKHFSHQFRAIYYLITFIATLFFGLFSLKRSTYLPQFTSKVDKNQNYVKLESVQTLLRIIRQAPR